MAKRVATVKRAKDEVRTAGTIVLQWLTYGLWGWAVVALIALTQVVYISFSVHEPQDELAIFLVIAAAVTSVGAFLCDSMYSRREPHKKRGAELGIAATHAVLFAFLGVASLVAFLSYLFVVYGTSEAGFDVQSKAQLFSSIVALGLFTILFIRVQSPFPGKVWTKGMSWGLSIVALMLLVLGVTGPLMDIHNAKADDLTDAHVSAVHESIEEYVGRQKRLPRTLDELAYASADVRDFVQSGAIDYRTQDVIFDEDTSSQGRHVYTLCTTYKTASRGYIEYGPHSAVNMIKAGATYVGNPYNKDYHLPGRVCDDFAVYEQVDS